MSIYITESLGNTVINNARSAANLLKQFGFRKGKQFKGVRGANYYIGDNCGLILYSNGIYFPRRYNITDNIVNTDYTLKNTLPILGLSLRKNIDVTETQLQDLVAYTLLNNGRDTVLFFPTTIDEIKENIEVAQEDGVAIRSIIDSYLEDN